MGGKNPYSAGILQRDQMLCAHSVYVVIREVNSTD